MEIDFGHDVTMWGLGGKGLRLKCYWSVGRVQISPNGTHKIVCLLAKFEGMSNLQLTNCI